MHKHSGMESIAGFLFARLFVGDFRFEAGMRLLESRNLNLSVPKHGPDGPTRP